MKPEIDLTIIGDLALNHDVTPYGKKTSIGGSAYYSAVGASLFSQRTGVVSRVGTDFDISFLKTKNIDVSGIKVVPEGKTCLFILVQHLDNTRNFTAERGVAENVNTKIIPDNYLTARYIHLSTSLPQHQLTWINSLRGKTKALISVDAFEPYIENYPEQTKEVLNTADLIFINAHEANILHQLGGLISDVPWVLKKGAYGVVYLEHGEPVYTIPAPKVNAVETTGAGDVLAGTLLALRTLDVPIENALELAVKTASQSTTNFGVEHLVEKKPHIAVGVLIVNNHGKIFLAKSPKWFGKWIVPGGHLENESIEECAQREVLEEAGLEIKSIKFLQTQDVPKSPEFYKPETHFVFINVTAKTSQPKVEIQLDNQELQEYCFIEPQKALESIDLNAPTRVFIEAYLESRQS